MSKIREKIFRNQESGLSLEGLIDVYDRVPWNPKNKDENSIKAEYLEYRELLVNKSDFRELATIGKGHFGVVKLVQDRHSSSKSYAMKRMPKGLVSAERSRLERSIMSQAKSEWITKLRFAFQDRKYLYLIMEYCPGGDLRALLDR